ncbi:LADA_0G01420g1_1 [Lachancea dasiensis]|uniref:LADA_0G01420g1_1 n=1 Tax=Lachancea dasiensis TaxID=1072105 RepID=A0A1G4JQR0_9SACH|nr:LADA_0G01420g1_1 [Lachancea dasiensis]
MDSSKGIIPPESEAPEACDNGQGAPLNSRDFDLWSSEDFIRAIDNLYDQKGDVYNIDLLLARVLNDQQKAHAYLRAKAHADIPKTLQVMSRLGPSAINHLMILYDTKPEALNLLKTLSLILTPSNTCIGEKQSMSEVNDEVCQHAPFIDYYLTVAALLLQRYDFDFHDFEPLLTIIVHQRRAPSLLPPLHAKYGVQLEKFLSTLIDSLLKNAYLDARQLLSVINILQGLYLSAATFCTDVFVSGQFQSTALRHFFDNDEVTLAILTLMGTACLDEIAKKYIAENCADELRRSLTVDNLECKAATTLVMLKALDFAKLKGPAAVDMAGALAQGFGRNGGITYDGLAIEGLAYLSLKMPVKTYLSCEPRLLNQLVAYLKMEEVPSSMYYGVLVIFGNVSDSLSLQTREQAMMQKLKAQVSYKSADEKDNIGSWNGKTVAEFCSEWIIDKGLIGVVIVHVKKFGVQTMGPRLQLLRIIYNVTRERGAVSSSVKQGCVVFLLESLAISSLPAELRIMALRSLARILTVMDPSLVFQKYSALNALPLLFEMVPHPDSTGSEVVEKMDTYESLLALTNLATLAESDTICHKISTTPEYWIKIENLLLDPVVSLQRSTIELLSNFMATSLHLAAKFFNFDNPKSVRNFGVLVKLLDLDDRQSQLGVAAIFANIACSVPFIAQELAQQPELVQNALRVFSEQCEDRELRRRLIVLFDALVSSNPSSIALAGNKQMLFSSLERARKFEAGTSSDYLVAIDNMLAVKL